MNRYRLKRVTDVGLILGCLTFVFLSWYAYFGLHRGNLGVVVLVNLFFGSGALYGLVSLTAKEFDLRTFALNVEQLGQAKTLIVSTIALVWAVCCFWLATMSREVTTLFQNAIGVRLPSFLYQAIFIVGGFFFGWSAIHLFNTAKK